MKATSALFLMASAAIVIIGCGGTNGTGLTGTNTSTNGGASSSSSGSTTNTSGSTTTTTSSSGGGNPVFAGTYVSTYTRGSGSIAVDMNSQNQIKVSFYDSSAGSYYGTGNLAGSSFQLTANSLTGGAAATVSGTFNDQNCQVHISGPFTVDSSTVKSDYIGNSRWYGNNYRALLWTGTLTGTATLQGSPLGPIKLTVTDGGDIYGHLDLGQDIYRGKGKVDNSGHFTLTISSLNGLPQYQLVGEVYPANPTTTAAIAVISDSNNHTGTVVASQSVALPFGTFSGEDLANAQAVTVWDHGTTVDVVYNKLQGISARASAPVSNGVFDVTANGVRFQGQLSGTLGSKACTLTLSGAVTWTPAMIYLSDGVLSPWTDARLVTLAGPFDEFGDTYQFSALLGGFFKVHTDGQGVVTSTPNVARPNVAGEAHYLNQIQVEGSVDYIDDGGIHHQLTVSRQ